MSLRSFHLVFLLLAIMGADLFGGWAVNEFLRTRSAGALALSVISFSGGFGLVGYAIWFVRKTTVTGIH